MSGHRGCGAKLEQRGQWLRVRFANRFPMVRRDDNLYRTRLYDDAAGTYETRGFAEFVSMSGAKGVSP